MDKILCVGSACKDIFFPTAEGKIIETPEDLLSQKKISFELGAKYRIEKIYEALGGCAANVASGLAKIGFGSLCVAEVGDDADGDWIKNEIKKNGAETELIITQKGKKSDLSAILVDIKSAERTIFSNKNSTGNLELKAEKMAKTNWIFIGDIHGKWAEQLESIIKLAIGEKKKIVFNPREANIHEDTAEIIEAIGLCEIVFVNKDEAIEIVSHMEKDASKEDLNDEKFLVTKLKSLEAKTVIITDGKRGAWAVSDANIYFAESLPVLAVDSTGAGDSFSSAFLAAYVKGKDLSECLKWGIVNSASVVEHYGSIEGLLGEKDILEKIKNVKINKL